MAKKQHKILVISSRSRDILVYKNGRKKLQVGGPIFWIRKTLQDIGIAHGNILAKSDARVEIKMPEEKGKIISCGKIKVASPLRADGIVISTIGDEFNLKDISKIHGVIALDVQGFVRTRKGANLDFKGVLKNIAILKATRSELETLAPTDVRDQKKRILLITRGADGFEIFAEGQHYIFRNKKIAARDTIGAGDVLLTAFLVAFLRTNDSKLAGSFALDYVTKFIENKSNGQNKKHIQKG